MNSEQLLSTAQVAKILGISRIAVFKNIQSGKIKAEKVGRNYVIRKKNLIEDILRDEVPSGASKEEKQDIREKIEKALQSKIKDR